MSALWLIVWALWTLGCLASLTAAWLLLERAEELLEEARERLVAAIDLVGELDD